ncbi:MAG: hypothetical protein ACRBCS_13855 [Cellvibrionaceae bacterium]
MSDQMYDVVYIDKFTDVIAARLFRTFAKTRFNLSNTQLDRLSSGKPIVVKRRISRDKAKEYHRAFIKMGGVCWIQPTQEEGQYWERRAISRRKPLDRRESYRPSTSFRNRRRNKGRRNSDMRRL